MTKRPPGLAGILRDLEQSSERSSLFWFMLDHHAAMSGAVKGGRVRWSPSLLAKFAALGLTDGENKPPSMESARRTWRHVRATIAAQCAHQLTGAPPGRRQRPQTSRDWQPPTARSPPSSAQNAAQALTVPSGRSNAPAPGHAPQEEAWAHVWREIDRKSGR